MVNDTVGDFIIRLKNAGMVGNATVSAPYSKLRQAIAEKLKEAGYVSSVNVAEDGKFKKLEVGLRYDKGAHAISGVKRISKPGRRLYSKVTEIHPVKFGKGNMILSTPAGILTDAEAREKRVGGEQLFIIW
ncbi:30S ribosomal protein S8 [Candidatus Kaiserbacteria bacterium]|nr:30S ribosomal protein S8 [Candidatus Kaiserbacteria bacterium]